MRCKIYYEMLLSFFRLIEQGFLRFCSGQLVYIELIENEKPRIISLRSNNN
jgi:hypothetical protein